MKPSETRSARRRRSGSTVASSFETQLIAPGNRRQARECPVWRRCAMSLGYSWTTPAMPHLITRLGGSRAAAMGIGATSAAMVLNNAVDLRAVGSAVDLGGRRVPAWKATRTRTTVCTPPRALTHRSRGAPETGNQRGELAEGEQGLAVANVEHVEAVLEVLFRLQRRRLAAVLDSTRGGLGATIWRHERREPDRCPAVLHRPVYRTGSHKALDFGEHIAARCEFCEDLANLLTERARSIL